MGAWGSGPFENDDAVDWVGELYEGGGLDTCRSALRVALTDNYLEMYVGAAAIAAVRRKTIPTRCFVVAMETSSELPHAKMGDGPILRVGDKASTFTSEVTAYCHRIARELSAADKSFIYQRRLMDGGTCESSAYCNLGYEATGLCVALGNYHNVNVKRKRLGPEYIDIDDFDNVVKWFVELARASRPYTGRDEALRSQLESLERRYKTLLRSSVHQSR